MVLTEEPTYPLGDRKTDRTRGAVVMALTTRWRRGEEVVMAEVVSVLVRVMVRVLSDGGGGSVAAVMAWWFLGGGRGWFNCGLWAHAGCGGKWYPGDQDPEHHHHDQN
ncbi:hypothetical protein Tco_0215453 [Tanacetum coccineum]